MLAFCCSLKIETYWVNFNVTCGSHFWVAVFQTFSSKNKLWLQLKLKLWKGLKTIYFGCESHFKIKFIFCIFVEFCNRNWKHCCSRKVLKYFRFAVLVQFAKIVELLALNNNWQTPLLENKKITKVFSLLATADLIKQMFRLLYKHGLRTSDLQLSGLLQS